MFTILAHGVKNADLDQYWSIAQHKLMNSKAPVRICSAPTGAGKTRVFLEIAKRRLVFFVVPTQALAKNIEKDAKEKAVPAVVWDFTQTQALGEGERVWEVRYEQFKDMEQSGGMVICTLEILARLTFGKPLSSGMWIDVHEVLSTQTGIHIVFDEAHTLNARAFGLVQLWVLLACIIHHQNDGHFDKLSDRKENAAHLPKLNLLSATHSNVFTELRDKFLVDYQGYIDIFDEEILPVVTSTGSVTEPDRWIHGDVDVIWRDASLLDTVREVAAEILARGERLLLIYDSLYQFAKDEKALADIFRACGLQPESEVFAINGMDKKAGVTQGGGRFQSGLEPDARHRVIIGTSAVEMGVNFTNLNHAIIEHGMDAATLLQRIGRVARGPDGKKQDGQVYVCRSAWAGEKTTNEMRKLQQLDGQHHIDDIRAFFSPLREIPFDQAQRLGGAYWSMLTRQHSAKGLIWEVGIEAWRLFSGNKDDNPCRMLNKLHQTPKNVTKSWKTKKRFETWLKQIDKTLEDVRGFAPTVKLKFVEQPIIEYEQDWVMKNMQPPDDFTEEEGKDVLVYHKPRDACLLDKKQPVVVSYFSPVGGIQCEGWNEKEWKKDYLRQLKSRYLKREPGRDEVLRFVESTGLLARDEKVEKGSDFSEMVL
jgi:superfamily II DNA or RNA helicase